MTNSMILRHSKASPFCRKVDIAAMHHGVYGDITAQDAVVTDETDDLRMQNPLGKIPVLVLEDFTTIYDSDVIVEYIESIGTGEKLITEDAERIEVLTLHALAKGITEAAVTVIYEGRLRAADNYDMGFVAYQLGKVERGLDALESKLPALDRLNVGNIMVACALDYLNLRINDDFENKTQLDENKGLWQTSHPKLIKWLEDFKIICPYFDETCPYRD